MTTYVRVRDDAISAKSFGLVPGASYPASNEGTGSTSLRVVTLSGDFVAVPTKLLELPVH